MVKLVDNICVYLRLPMSNPLHKPFFILFYFYFFTYLMLPRSNLLSLESLHYSL